MRQGAFAGCLALAVIYPLLLIRTKMRDLKQAMHCGLTVTAHDQLTVLSP